MDPDAEIEQEKLEIYGAMLAAIDQRREVMDAVAASETVHDAAHAISRLLGVSEVAGREVLNMQVRRLAKSARRDIEQRMADLRRRT